MAFVLNAVFSIIELIGGYLTNSVAIMSDALHDFGDSLALLFSYFAEKYSGKEADDKFTFGYRRFSILAALVNGGILLVGSIFVIYEAIGRLQAPEVVEPKGMLFLAILGIIVNSIAAWKLSNNKGVNIKMIMLHLLEDLYGWVAVLIVSIVLFYKPWFFLDSILSIGISLFILSNVFKNLKKVFMIFLQHFPTELELKKIVKSIENLNLVDDVHDIKGWSLDNEHHYLRFHVRVPEDTTMGEIDCLKLEIKSILKSFDVSYSTIEFESAHCRAVIS